MELERPVVLSYGSKSHDSNFCSFEYGLVAMCLGLAKTSKITPQTKQKVELM